MPIKISILLSYHKGERFLKTYLENVEQQTMFDDIELVAVTSVLNENEKKLFYSFKERHPNNITLLDDFKLGSQGYYWNMGLIVARGKYACIWNVDDLRTSYSIENQYKTMIKNQSAVATFGRFIISKQYGVREGQLIDQEVYSYSKEEYQRSMLLGPFFMFDTDNEKVEYFDEQLKSAADFDFAIRLAKSGDIIMTDSIDGYFLDEGSGLSTRGDGLQPLERTVVELRYKKFAKIEEEYIEKAQSLYDIENIVNFGKKISV